MNKLFLLVAFVGALLTGAWLSSASDVRSAKVHGPRRPEPSFPSHPEPTSVELAVRRQTLDAGGSQIFGEKLDPLLVALPVGATTVVIFEASAMRESSVGQIFFRCLGAHKWRHDRTMDLMTSFAQNVDRIAVTETLTVAIGDFKNVTWEGISENQGMDRQYGSEGRIRTSATGEAYNRTLAKFGSEMFLVGQSQSGVQTAIDRLEGRSHVGGIPLDSSLAYGDVYGVVDAKQFSQWVPKDIAQTVAETVTKVELHIDVADDILIVADFTGPDPEKVEKLGRAVTGALGLARIEASNEGDEELSELLEYASVVPRPKEFRVELALPVKAIRRALGNCASQDETVRDDKDEQNHNIDR